MTDCPNGEIRDSLPDLLHGRLAGAERAVVEAHVAGCGDCRDELALLTTLRTSLRRTPVIDRAAIAAALPARGAAASRRWAGAGGWRAAAAIAAIAVGGASLAIVQREPTQLAPPAVATTVAVGGATMSPATPVTSAAPLTSTGSAATPGAPRELAVTGAVSDLSDAELAALIGDLKTLDVVPSADVEPTTLVPGAATSSIRGTL